MKENELKFFKANSITIERLKDRFSVVMHLEPKIKRETWPYPTSVHFIYSQKQLSKFIEDLVYVLAEDEK